MFETFRSVLGRVPTPAERADWSGKLLRGTPIATLRAGLEAMPARPRARRPEPPPPEAGKVLLTGLFDAAWYGRRYPDTREAGVNPLYHYAGKGWREDRAPNPYFDPVWYRAAQGLPAHENPLFHYAAVGEANGFRPSPRFDPAWYRATYGLDAALSPLVDFLRHRHEGTIAPCPELWAASWANNAAVSAEGPDDDVFLASKDTPPEVTPLRGSGVFDDNYYVLHSGDVLESGADPLRHYCVFGWREQRQPNFYFDCRFYVATNPEVTRLGVNPLAHYLLVGEKTGRRPIVFFDPVWYRQTHALTDAISPLGHFLAHRREGAVSPNALFDPAWYAKQKGETPRPGRDPFARFLIAGLTEDVSPSPDFDLASWRRRSRGRPSRHFRHLLDPGRDNPLVDYLLRHYE